jgi:hypothetical protein
MMSGLANAKGRGSSPLVVLLICSAFFAGTLPAVAVGQAIAGGGFGFPLDVAAVLAISATPTVTPTPTSTPALPAGYVLYFDGGDYVDLGPDEILNPTDEYTIEAWVRPAQTTSDAVILSRDDTMAGLAYALWMIPDFYHFVVGPPYAVAYSVSPPEIDVWTHLAAVYDFGTIRLYRDGVLQTELSGAGTASFTVSTLVGALFESGTVVPQWQGWIDEVRFWNVARTGPEISQWMSQPLSGSPAGLIGYWNFDEGSGQVAHDSSPSGLDGTLGGSLAPGDDDPSWVLPDATIPPTPTETPTITETATQTITPTPTITNTPWDHPPMDCDGNGIADPIQIAASPELDCNANGILDVCETGDFVRPPLEQDICELAQWICPGEKYYGTTTGATVEAGITGACGSTDLSPDVWYLYSPEQDGTLIISACDSSLETVLDVYDGCPAAGGQRLICRAANCGDHRVRAEIWDFPVTAGQRYYIRVAGLSGQSGDFSIRLIGPPCNLEDCNHNGIVDGCDSVTPCGDDVLCYDDGDGTADTIINRTEPASFLVKFSVPDTFTGLKQVAKITWYPGSGTIQNPKAVVRRDLADGFGTTKNCIAEPIDHVVPGRMNAINLRENPKEFLVAGGDVFYAGIYGARISLGAESNAVTLTQIGTNTAVAPGRCWYCHGYYWCSSAWTQIEFPVIAPPSLGRIPCWNGMNYRLDAGGTSRPSDLVATGTVGGEQCEMTYWRTHHWGRTCDPCWPGYCHSAMVPVSYARVICTQKFQQRGYDWLIRATLAGTWSPELSPGCYDRTFPVGTPTNTPTDTPTNTSTPTNTPTPTDTPTPTATDVPRYGNITPVAELNSSSNDFHPCLTADLLEIFFVSERGGDRDIWSATRESVDSTWNAPFPVVALNSTSEDSWPVISANGLEIFFTTYRDIIPGNDFNSIYRAVRSQRDSAWLDPVRDSLLSPPHSIGNNAHPSHMSVDGLRIYTSRKVDGGDYGIHVSSRTAVGGGFFGTSLVPGNVNSGASEAGAALSGDEMLMIFGRHTGVWNLFVATRDTPGGPFTVIREMTDLNDPLCGTQLGYVSPDLQWIWFSSTRPDCPGDHDIFVAEVAGVQETPAPTDTPPVTPTVPTGVSRPLWIFR